MKAPEYLKTERLILRRPRLDDAEAIFARYANDREVTRYLSWPRHESLEQTLSFLGFSDSEWESRPAGPYLIESRESGVLLGSTGFSFAAAFQAETGYVFARDAWGKGYATESLSALMTLCRPVGLRRVYASCHFEHVASQRVLGKCGFLRDDTSLHHSEFPNLGVSAPQQVMCYERIL